MICEINIFLCWFFRQCDEHHINIFRNHESNIVLINLAEHIIANLILMQIPRIYAFEHSLIFLVITHISIILINNLTSNLTIVLQMHTIITHS